MSFPRLNQCIAAHAPYLSAERATRLKPDIHTITEDVIKQRFALTSANPLNGIFLSAALVYKVDDIPQYAIHDQIVNMVQEYSIRFGSNFALHFIISDF